MPEPHKRPRSSWIRFEAAAPNDVWQSDFTHWRLADGEVEIINWLDDHSRYLLACTAFARVSGDDVVATFTAAGDAHGWPAATLTDNGSVYTSRFTGGRNGFEYLLAYLGIRQKNGAPGHPQTQGKMERFHQTLKRWLGQRPAASSLAGLQGQLDAFRLAYNEQRPHRAVGRATPGEAYRATPKAQPSEAHGRGHFRLRYDITDAKGVMTLRRSGRMHHLIRSARRTPAAGSSPSSTSGRSRSSISAPARSSRPISSNPTRATGATNEKTPVDGRGQGYRARRRCHRCRDSCVTDVATQDIGGDEGTRTPDPRDANAVLFQLSYIPTRARSLAQPLRSEPLNLGRRCARD